MEFLNSNTDYDGNRRLDEGNDITCILSNFGGGEFCCRCCGAELIAGY